MIAWFVADEAGGNGFIAAFVGGSAAGMAAGSLRDRLLDFAEGEGQLLGLAVFFIFGVVAHGNTAAPLTRSYAGGMHTPGDTGPRPCSTA